MHRRNEYLQPSAFWRLARRICGFAVGAAIALLVLLAAKSALVADVPAVLQLAQAERGRPADEDRSPYRNPLVRAFGNQLDAADDLADGDRRTAAQTLETADEALQRIKHENQRGLREANRQLRVRRCEQCNILLIVLDDVGYGDLGCYGQEQIKTPHIDRLAAEGIRFTQFYAGNAHGVPSRGSLWSGKHAGHGVERNGELVTLQLTDKTIPEVLWRAGYCTALIGKWGVGDLSVAGRPNEQGFEYFFGYLDRLAAENYYPETLWRNNEQVRIGANADGGKGRYSLDLLTDDAVAYLRRQSDHDRPFFLSVCYPAAHANNALANETGNGMQVPSDAPYADENWPGPEKSKAALIALVDEHVGRLLTALDENRQADHTLVIVTSDNGPHREGGVDPDFFASSGPLRGIKNELYEGGIRVPLVVRNACWHTDVPKPLPPGVAGQAPTPGRKNLQTEVFIPGRGKITNYFPGPGAAPRQGVVETLPGGGGAAARVSDHVWAAYDLLPTLGRWADALRMPRDVDGLNVDAVLHGSPADEHEYLYWELGGSVAVRMGDWKAVRPQGGAWELYDLRSDVGEAHNVAADHGDILDRIGRYADRARARRD